MQYPQNHGYTQQAQQPQQPGYQTGQMQQPSGKPHHRPGRFRRFMRGYFMLVGVLTTLYVLVQLLVLLFVEIGKWTPTL